MMLYGEDEAEDLSAKEKKVLKMAIERELRARADKRAAHRGAVRKVR